MSVLILTDRRRTLCERTWTRATSERRAGLSPFSWPNPRTLASHTPSILLGLPLEEGLEHGLGRLGG